MNALVQSLAALSGLRDRDALDAALVRLVLSSSEGAVHSATLVRVVGEGDDRRCLVQARLDAGQTQVSRDLLWTDWTTLPHVSDFPLRQMAVDRARAVHAETAPYTGVIPLLTSQGTWGLLEFGSEQPLSASMLDLVEGILLTYNNLLGLLDYGEKDALTELLNRKTFDGAFFKATAEQHGDVGGDDARMGARVAMNIDAELVMRFLSDNHIHANDTV